MTNRINRLHSFLEQNPNDEFSIYALALEYKKLNQIDESIRMFTQCIQINNSNLASYYQLCEIYASNNQIDLFKHYVEKAKNIATEQNDIKTLNELISLEDETI